MTDPKAAMLAKMEEVRNRVGDLPCNMPWADAMTDLLDVTNEVLKSLATERHSDKQRADTLEASMGEIRDWADGYAVDLYPEPDFVRAAEVLTAAGISMNAVTASVKRHILRSVARVAQSAIDEVTE